MLTLGLTGTTKSEAKSKVENKPTVENKPQPEEKPKSRKKWVVMGAAVVVVCAACALFFAFPNLLGFGKTSANRDQKSTRGVEQVKAVLSLEPFLVNLADMNEVRFLKATFQLGLAEEPNEEAKNAVAVAAIRDSIISLLSSASTDEILTSRGKDKLREEIRLRINSISPKLKVLEVYIVDFVVQF
jgi:flagellar basal body-associated protein FliL